MSLHRRPDGSQVNVGLLRHALLGGTSLSSLAFSADFTVLTSLPSWLSFSRASNAMVFDSTGTLTYAPNNFLIQSNNFSDAAWNKDTGGSITATGVSDPFGGTTASTFTAGSNGSRLYQGVGGTSDNINSLWIRRRTGTGAVTLWQNGGNVDVTSSVSGTWSRVALKTTLGGYGNYCLLTLGTSGDAIDICQAQTEAVTYETSPRAYNATTSAAYYGPRFDHALTYAPNNLLVYSSDLTNGAWSTINQATVTAGQTDPLGGTNACRLQGTGTSWFLGQTITIPGNGLLAVWVKSNTGSNQNFRLFINSFSAVSGDLIATTSWQRFSFVGLQAGTATVGLLREAAGTTADLLVYAAAASAVTYETSPRPADQVITTSAPYGSPLTTVWVSVGLSIEEQRTNLLVYSADLNNANWSKDSSGTITSSSRPAPDGTNTAFTFTAGGAGTGRIYQAYGSTVGQPYTNTIWIRRRTGTGVINVWNPAAATIDVTSQVSGTWNRIPVTATAAGGTFVLVQVMTAGDEIDIWGPQTELGSFPTSYVPTTTAAVTRSADIVSLAGAALTALQASNWSVVMQTTDSVIGFFAQYLFESPSPNAAGLLEQYGASSTQISTQDNTVSNNNLVATLGSGAVSGALQMALGRDASGRSLAVNGGTVVTDVNPSSIAGTGFYIGSQDGSANFANAHFARLAIYSSRLSDTDLQAKSVVGAAF